MKTRFVKSILTLLAVLLIVFTNSSCKKDALNVHTLEGRWFLKPLAPPGAVDAVAYYVFDKDGNCNFEVTDLLDAKDWVIEYRYTLNEGTKLLTLIGKNNDQILEFKVKKFTENYMKLMPINTGKTDPTDLELSKQ